MANFENYLESLTRNRISPETFQINKRRIDEQVFKNNRFVFGVAN
jgi:hypothetical protein